MPLYVYKCNDCENQFEVRQRFSDEPLTVCPKCEGQIRRVINPVGVVFKGSGFYVTDSRNGKKSSLVNGKSQTEEKSETTEKKSDDKSTPAASTTTSESKSPASSKASES
jgi:putative FmdB family regulatory protein